MKIAVTGSTGQLGRIVINRLKAKIPAQNIVALARSPEKGADLGVEVRTFDYDQPDPSALDGVDTLLLISASEVGKRVRQHLNILDAARKSGIRWIVYTSLLHADNSSIGLAKEHHETETALQESGIPWTILRNGWYTENYTASIPAAVEAGAMIGSAGNGRISLAPRKDYAEAAVAVLVDGQEKHEGKVYELAGDEALTLSEIAEELSRQVGRTIPYRNLPVEEYAKTLAGFGLDEGLAGAIASWDSGAAIGDLFNESRHLSQLIGRPTTPVSETIAEVLSGMKK